MFWPEHSFPAPGYRIEVDWTYLFPYCSHVSTKVIHNLGDVVRHRQRLRITCLACEKETLVQPMALLTKVPSNTTLDALSRKLRCSTCGQKTGKVEVAS